MSMFILLFMWSGVNGMNCARTIISCAMMTISDIISTFKLPFI